MIVVFLVQQLISVAEDFFLTMRMKTKQIFNKYTISTLTKQDDCAGVFHTWFAQRESMLPEVSH